MIRAKKPVESLSTQMKHKAAVPVKKKKEWIGNFNTLTSTGSTLLDLSISGKRKRGGKIPGGVLIEAFGPSQSGKTALLCETAGHIERNGGENQFHDPESRLDSEFADIYGMNIEKKNYYIPDTVTEVFKQVRLFKPKSNKVVNGIFADSLAALSTKLEMGSEDGDKMGMRRAKEFSEQLRKTCRLIKRQNLILMCSNQIRESADSYGSKYTTPGGQAVKFYASIRLKFNTPDKIAKTITVNGKEVEKVIGIKTEIEVIKTVDEPYRKCSVYFIYGYGIDDIRANLQFVKDYSPKVYTKEEGDEKKSSIYTINGRKLHKSLNTAISMIEEQGLVEELREQVIDLWEEIENKFKQKRKPKR